MTGFGEARVAEGALSVSVEVRTINSRYFKLSLRANEPHGALEGNVERVVRGRIKRGTVQVQIFVARTHRADDYRINRDVLDSYRRQLTELGAQWHASDAIRLESLLALPGVVEESSASRGDFEHDWPIVERALGAALHELERMRAQEGESLAVDLRENAAHVVRHLDAIEARLPQLSGEYRQRLVERINRALADAGASIQPSDVLREIALYAERSDVSEEIVRLRSHLSQFELHLAERESSGRKLDFVTQEMFREANTIGSKSSDKMIPPLVVEIKTAIERMREQVQNVE